MEVKFSINEIPIHLREYFEPEGGGNGVRNYNSHPT